MNTSQLMPNTGLNPGACVANKFIHVAVGVIENDRGEILIAKRSESQHQGGLWEFPGGKVERNETVHQALVRELFEELDIHVDETEPLIQIRHDYPDKSVFLDVLKVTGFLGVAVGKEGQPLVWVSPSGLSDYQFPAANKPILKAIELPNLVCITGKYDGLSDFSGRLSQALQSPLSFDGNKLLVLRPPSEGADLSMAIVGEAKRLISSAPSQVALLASSSWCSAGDVESYSLAGIHLNSKDLSDLNERPIGTDRLVGASCHSAAEIYKAQQLDLDYIFLSPVYETASHPEAQPLGLDKASELIRTCTMPVYALGGLKVGDLSSLRSAGFQGIAAISAFW